MSESTKHRRPVASHGQQRTPGVAGQLIKMVAVAVAVVLVSGIAVVAYVGGTLFGDYQASAVELEGQEPVPPDIGEYEGGFNFLLVGVDTCEAKYADLFGDRCSGNDAEGTLNDVNLLVRVSDSPRRVTAISFPRDTELPIPSCTAENGSPTSAMSKQPLNSAWNTGGLSCVAKTITELTGQEIQFAASVTFGGVIEITNAIGGVEVCLASGIDDPQTGLQLDAGTYEISGMQALQFLRTRYGVGDGSDLGRISNQQQYLSSLARKLISSEVLGNVPTMLKLAGTALSNITPSTSLRSPMTIAQIALAVKDVPFQDIVFLQYPTNTDPANPAKVVPNRAAADELFAALEANAQLQVTYEYNANDGVVGGTDAGGTPTDDPPPPSEGATPPPTAGSPVVELPESIKGSSAQQPTCSNGNVRN